jgi:hypothetical protein
MKHLRKNEEKERGEKRKNLDNLKVFGVWRIAGSNR